MDEALDPDIGARAFALEAAMWFIDKTGSEPCSVGDVTNLAECFLHYIGNGELNAFECTEKLRRTVRGGI